MNRQIERPTASTLPSETGVRFPIGPLATRMGIVLLVDGMEGGQQRDQALESHSQLAERLGVSKRTVRRWLGPADRWGHLPGLSWEQADRYAVMAGFMAWQVWPEWEAAGPGEEDLFDRPCRCRPADRVPLAGECDRCGGRLEVASRRAA